MIKTDIFMKLSYSEADIKSEITNTIPVTLDEIGEVAILKRTLTNTGDTFGYKMTVAFSVSPEREAGLLKMKKKISDVPDYSFNIPSAKIDHRPVVIGAGPCGLFAALYLAEAGVCPIILERGLPVEDREKKILEFNLYGTLDKECNIQFGEGGAGTYSDGKLKVGSMDKYKMKVLEEFILAGAKPEIAYTVGAHLGTDKLPTLVKNIREKIKTLGGEFIFSAKASELVVKDNKLSCVRYQSNGKYEDIPTSTVIVATGHSAEDSFRMLERLGLPMEARGFGIGMRIEHPREYIDSIVYGKNKADGLETASYHLVTHLNNGRSVYSFCMCPGGSVVAATSNEGCVVTNGMSEEARMGDNSNAALLVSLTPADFGDDLFGGIRLQRTLEGRAFDIAGKTYNAPAQRLTDFLANKKSSVLDGVTPSYPRGVQPVSHDDYLPGFITESLRYGIIDFDNWMQGFNYGDAVLTGVETRSTSPIRVLRSENYSAIGFEGIFPAGEGAGYAGGIVSSATDGLRSAEAALKRFLK